MDTCAPYTYREISATAKMICDSIFGTSRLCSIEIEFPRPYLAEFNTHGRLSRNSASSRAIPTVKRILAVLERPYVPHSFGTNKPGMQAGEELSGSDREKAVTNWLFGRDMAVIQAFYLAGGHAEMLAAAKKAGLEAEGEILCQKVDELVKMYGLRKRLFHQDKGLHKQHANRVLEPYGFHVVIATGTHWRNFLGLRVSANAQPEANDFGIVVAKAMMNSKPTRLERGQWHLPYIRQEDRAEVSDQLVLAKASTGKCARTSYLTHDGLRAIAKDLDLANGLRADGHMSPFQHPARPREKGDPVGSNGNYSRVWTQFRKLLPNEGDFTMLSSPEDLLIGCRGDQALADYILSLEE